jgi:hypothetical protein
MTVSKPSSSRPDAHPDFYGPYREDYSDPKKEAAMERSARTPHSTQDDIAEVRDTLRANGVSRYGRYERENTYGALDALKRLEEQLEAANRALAYYAERRNYRPPAGNTTHDVPLGGWMERQDSYDGDGAGARARAVLYPASRPT